MLVNSVVDPETDQTTSLPAKFVKTDKTTTNGGRRQFGNVNWCHVGASTDTNTGQDTTADNKTETAIAIGTEHHTGANHENSREQNERPSTAEKVTADIGE